MNSCSQVGNPHVWFANWPIGPDYWSFGDHFMVLEVQESFLPLNHLGYWPSCPLPLAQHLTLMWPILLQLSHFTYSLLLAWKITFESLLLEVGPCHQLHSVLRCEIITFRSNTPPRVLITGSQEGVSMDSIMIPMNCESVTVTLSLPQVSLSLWRSVMCPSRVSEFPSMKHFACRWVCARFCTMGAAWVYWHTRLSQAVFALEQSSLAWMLGVNVC